MHQQHVIAPVRPALAHSRGLSQEQEEEAVITDDGQIVPRNSAERMAAENEVEDVDVQEEPPAQCDELEDEQEVSFGAGNDKVSSDFICDDGQPSGEVCRCRLLFWCRFKTRKGMTVLARGARGGVGKVERCSYSNCPHPTMSSNDRWHFISPSTASGGRDWSELMGQTLCSSCFQQYRNKGTLVRARDSGAM